MTGILWSIVHLTTLDHLKLTICIVLNRVLTVRIRGVITDWGVGSWIEIEGLWSRATTVLSLRLAVSSWTYTWTEGWILVLAADVGCRICTVD